MGTFHMSGKYPELRLWQKGFDIELQLVMEDHRTAVSLERGPNQSSRAPSQKGVSTAAARKTDLRGNYYVNQS